jgi:hypothetical protein
MVLASHHMTFAMGGKQPRAGYFLSGRRRCLTNRLNQPKARLANIGKR